MTNSLGQILEIKDLIDSKQFSEAGKKTKKLKSNLELKRLFEFQILVQNKKTKLKKFKITYYDNLKYFEELGQKKFLILFHNLAGDYYFDQNKFGHAINDYDCCLKFDTENTHAIMGLAKSYRLLGLYQISEKYYLKITHSYDWNLDNLENNLESDIPLDYTSLREIIANKNFRFLSKNVLVDIGVLYASNNDNITGNDVFEAILENLPEQNTLDSSYLVVTDGNSNRVNDNLDNLKLETKNPLSTKIKFITEIKNYFPDFFSKYESEINKGKFTNSNKKGKTRGVITVRLNNSTSKLFFIHKKELGKKNIFVYTIASEPQRFEEITSALFLYLADSYSIKNLIKTINIEFKNTYLPPEEILLYYLRSLRDDLSLFLFKKKLYNKGYLDYPFYYLKRSNQIIKEIREDIKFEDKLEKITSQKSLKDFRKKLEEEWDDYSQLPELVKIEDSTRYRYDEITDYVKRRLNYFKDKAENKNRKKSIKP